MKIVRWLLGGLAFGVITQITGGIIYGVLFPNWYDPQMLRPMDHPYFKLGLPVINCVQGLLLAFVYAVLYKGILSKSPVAKGVIFGLLLWIGTSLPGMLIEYCVIPMRFPMPCLINTFIAMVVGCLVIAAIWGKSLEPKD